MLLLLLSDLHAEQDCRLVEVRLKDSGWRSEVWPIEACITVFGHEMKTAYSEVDPDAGCQPGTQLVHKFERRDFSTVRGCAGTVDVGTGIHRAKDDAGIDEWSYGILRERPFREKRKVP